MGDQRPTHLETLCGWLLLQLVFWSLVCCSGVAYADDKPDLMWEFNRTPDVRICYGDGPSILNALAWLQSMGWRFGVVRVGGCTGSPVGEVWTIELVDEMKWKPNNVGQAVPLRQDGEVVGGYIMVAPEHKDNDLIWIHEFGHIFGLDHMGPGSPMCPYVDCMGYTTANMWRRQWYD